MKLKITKYRQWISHSGLALVVVMMVIALVAATNQCSFSMSDVRWMPLAGCALLYAAYCAMNAYAWVLILQTAGFSVRPTAGIQLWIRSEAFRWLPGSVWNFGVRSVESAKLGVPLTAACGSMAMELALTIFTRGFLGLVGIWLFGRGILSTLAHPTRALVIATTIVLLAFAGFSWLKGSKRLRAKFGELQEAKHLFANCWSWREPCSVLLYYLGISIQHGLALYLLVQALVPFAEVSVVAVVIANSIAWLIGFFAVFAPSGIVVREAALAAALSQWMSPSNALAIAIAWRIVQTLVELLLLLFALSSFSPTIAGAAGANRNQNSLTPTTQQASRE